VIRQIARNTFYEILKEKETSLAVNAQPIGLPRSWPTYEANTSTMQFMRLRREIHRPESNLGLAENCAKSRPGREARREVKDAFYEARLNISRCRYFSAMKQSATPAAGSNEAKQTIHPWRSFTRI